MIIIECISDLYSHQIFINDDTLADFLAQGGGDQSVRRCRENLLNMLADLKILARMVEWVEMLTALGAERIFAYNLEVHPNITKVKLGGFPNMTKVKLGG